MSIAMMQLVQPIGALVTGVYPYGMYNFHVQYVHENIRCYD